MLAPSKILWHWQSPLLCDALNLIVWLVITGSAAHHKQQLCVWRQNNNNNNNNNRRDGLRQWSPALSSKNWHGELDGNPPTVTSDAETEWAHLCFGTGKLAATTGRNPPIASWVSETQLSLVKKATCALVMKVASHNCQSTPHYTYQTKRREGGP